jgi:hypothetical protein
VVTANPNPTSELSIGSSVGWVDSQAQHQTCNGTFGRLTLAQENQAVQREKVCTAGFATLFLK